MSVLNFDLSRGAFLFDCDGTITDENFLPHIVGKTIRNIVESQGYDFDQACFDQVFEDNKGGGFDKYYDVYLRAKGLQHLKQHISVREFSDQAIDLYVETTDAIARGEDVGVSFNVNQDAIKLIAYANENDIPVAIVTNANPRILEANLKAAGIGVAGETYGDVYADLTVHRGMYGGDNAPLRKPHPFPFEEACRLLGVDPAHCVGFEDSRTGHISMFDAGIGIRIHVSEFHPGESISFIKDDGEEFGVSALAPHGSLTPDFIQNLIDQRNRTGNIISLPQFPAAAANGAAIRGSDVDTPFKPVIAANRPS